MAVDMPRAALCGCDEDVGRDPQVCEDGVDSRRVGVRLLGAVLEVTAWMQAPALPEGPYLFFQPRRGVFLFQAAGV